MPILMYILAQPLSLIFFSIILIYIGVKLTSAPKKRRKGNIEEDGTISVEAREVNRPADDSAVQDLDSNPKDN